MSLVFVRVALALAVTLASSVSSTVAAPSIAVEVQQGRLTLEAREAPLAEVIRRIGEEAGFRTIVTGEPGVVVTRSLNRLSVEKGLRELLRHVPSVLLYEEHGAAHGRRRLVEVRVYAPSRPPRLASQTPASGTPQATRADAHVDGHIRERIRAVRELASSGDARAVETLVDVLREDGEANVRSHAAAALGQIGDERAVPALESALNDPEVSVRVQAIRALGRVGKPHAVQILGRVLLDGPDRRSRLTAAWSLGRHQTDAARSFLQAAASDDDAAVRRAANRILARWQ